MALPAERHTAAPAGVLAQDLPVGGRGATGKVVHRQSARFRAPCASDGNGADGLTVLAVLLCEQGTAEDIHTNISPRNDTIRSGWGQPQLLFFNRQERACCWANRFSSPRLVIECTEERVYSNLRSSGGHCQYQSPGKYLHHRRLIRRHRDSMLPLSVRICGDIGDWPLGGSSGQHGSVLLATRTTP